MLGVSSPLADVRGPQAVRDQRIDRLADQLAGQVAVDVLGAPVGQHDYAVVIGQDHAVVQGVGQRPQRRRSYPRCTSPTAGQGRRLALPLPGRGASGMTPGIPAATAACTDG